MTSNPFYLLTILTSSYLAFFSWALIVETLIVFFKIQKHRIRTTLRLLPFLSLIIDILFKNYSIANFINPLSCASCIQKLFLENFYPQLKVYLTCNGLSLTKHLGAAYQHSIFSIILAAFAITSAFFALRYLLQAVKGYLTIRSLVGKGVVSTRPINNMHLARKLILNKIQIYISDEIQIPLATFRKLIMIPASTMDLLSQDEFEAVIAHELEHVLNRDSIARLFFYFISILFWWVPTRSWIKKIEQEQELACDQNALSYGLQKESLASALLKVTKQLKASNQPVCYLTGEMNMTTTRIKTILGIGNALGDQISRFNIFLISVGIVLLLICFKYC